MDNVFKVFVNGNHLAPLEIFKFSGGETQVKFTNPTTVQHGCDVEIFALIRDGDIIPLALLVDAIHRTIPNSTLKLHLPYLPYARQDRVMTKGESLAVSVFCNMLNSLGFDSVTVDNCHSDVGLALIKNVIDNQQLVMDRDVYDVDLLIAPDAGALKKTWKYAKLLKLPVIRADKERDVATGNITGSVIYGDVKDKRVLIIDDICDGGRTFTELAKVLYEQGAKSVTLHVTHGIFSKGKEVLTDTGIKVSSQYDWTEL